MAGVYCATCQAHVILEQDGRSCSNCARILIAPATGQPTFAHRNRTPPGPPTDQPPRRRWPTTNPDGTTTPADPAPSPRTTPTAPKAA